MSRFRPPDSPFPRLKNERFFFGNGSHSVVSLVSHLPGRALATYYRHLGSLQLEGKGVLPVTLPNAFAFDLWGIDRHAQKRALSVLEGAGLIFCKITLLDPRP